MTFIRRELIRHLMNEFDPIRPAVTRGGIRGHGILQSILAIGAALSLAEVTARGDVTVAGIFADHVVLQRDRPVPVWGRAAAGERVTLTFAGQSKSTRADRDGRWRVQLEALDGSASPRELIVTGDASRLEIRDVLVGEVWLAGGQSNMRSPLFAAHDAGETIPRPAMANFVSSPRSSGLRLSPRTPRSADGGFLPRRPRATSRRWDSFRP
jgi:hypothetical protein